MKLNFNEIKRPTLEIVLNDEERTELTLVTPQKYEVDKFMNTFQNLVNKNNSDITMDDVYQCCAMLLSSNKEKIEITKEKVESIFLIDDVIALFQSYNAFILGLYNSKN